MGPRKQCDMSKFISKKNIQVEVKMTGSVSRGRCRENNLESC